MSSFTLNITDNAIEDLRDIYRFSHDRWGLSRTKQYLDTLESRISGLVDSPMLGAERPDLLAGLRSLSVESHVVFYRIRSQTVEVLRVLHTRQDAKLRLNVPPLLEH